MSARPTPAELSVAVVHGLFGWTLAAAATSVADWKTRAAEAAFSAHAVAVPVAFLLVAFVYFRRPRALRPVVAAVVFGVVVSVMDVVTMNAFHGARDMRALLLGAVVPAWATFASTCLAGLASLVTNAGARSR